MIYSTAELLAHPPLVFKKEILLHFSKCGQQMYQRWVGAVNLMHNPGPTKLENFRIAIGSIM